MFRPQSSIEARSQRRRVYPWAPRIVGMLVLVAAISSGCRNVRHEECRAFVYAINTRLGEIDRLTAQAGDGQNVSPAEMRRLAELYEKLADKAERVSIGSNELVQLRQEYRAMVLDAAKLARQIADALDAKNLESAMKAHGQFSAVVSREDELVTRVNAFCRQVP